MFAPNFNDIGKKIKDIFDKNFPAGFIKLSATFPKVNDISLNVNGSQNIDSGKLVSSFDTKMNMKFSNKDIILTEKWTIANEVQSILEINVTDNVKSCIELNYEPSSGRKSMKFKNNYSTEMINASGDIECRQIEPILTLSSMFKLIPSTPFYGGGLLSFDSYKQKFTKISYGIQYNNDNSCLTGLLTNHNELLFQAYKKSSGNNIEAGFEAGWNHDTQTTRLGVAVKRDFKDTNSLKAKIESNGYLSFGYTFLARDDVKLTFGLKLDSKNINGGGHKLGLQLEYIK